MRCELWGPGLCFFSRVRNLGVASPGSKDPAFLGIGPSVCPRCKAKDTLRCGFPGLVLLPSPEVQAPCGGDGNSLRFEGETPLLSLSLGLL